LAEGSDVVIAACGPLVGRALDAGRQLKEKGVAATVLSNPFINQVDVETIGAAVRKCSGRIVTIEDHQIVCGMGAQLSHALARAGILHRMRSLGIRGEFGQSAWVAEHLYEKHGLTAAALVEAAQGLLKET
jgi:transketolase